MRVTGRRSSGLLAHCEEPRRRCTKPVASAKPVSIMQNVSGDLLDGGAELHHLIGDAGDRVGSLDDYSTTTSNVQVELRGARSRSARTDVWGRVGWACLGWSAA
eukprot:494971-Prymnesium_polylepis.1